jgi:hypothetical protein
MNTHKTLWIIFAISMMGLIFSLSKPRADDKMEKAFRDSVIPNDFGPTTINVSHYPKKMQAYYKLFLARCSKCHTIARPINAQFLELTQKGESIAKKEDPEIFKDTDVWKVSPTIWDHYVHKMMSKHGAVISKKEGREIYEFLVYDSKKRKTGMNSKEWEQERKRLLKNLKEITSGL